MSNQQSSITRRSAGPQFSSSRAEVVLISKIAMRARAMAEDAGIQCEQMDVLMDIEACHCNGCPLKLEELLAAGDGDFGHDVFGIRRFIDRETGQLGGQFLPRFSQPQARS